MKSPLECLCGNDNLLVRPNTFDKDVVYEGVSKKIIGRTIDVEVVCSKCKRELIIELSICCKRRGEE